ncbi:MAG: vancomycin high temperature exclusion protein [Campylobacteraceae bacterium]
MKISQLIKISLACVTFALIGVLSIDFYMQKSTKPYIFDNVASLHVNEVAVLLGTSKRTSYGINPFYKYRLEGTAEAYKEKKVKYIIASGDNSRKTYSEPEDMRDDLVALGVHESDIYLDFAGFRTLDSVIRAKEIFGQNKFTIISQEFHCVRAIYLAKSYGLEAICLAVKSPDSMKMVRIREYIARTVAFLDVNILNRQPKFLGESVKVGS